MAGEGQDAREMLGVEAVADFRNPQAEIDQIAVDLIFGRTRLVAAPEAVNHRHRRTAAPQGTVIRPATSGLVRPSPASHLIPLCSGLSRSNCVRYILLDLSVDSGEGSVVLRIMFDRVARLRQTSSKYSELPFWVGYRAERTADRNSLMPGLPRLTASFP